MNLTEIYRAFYSTAPEYTSAHGTLGHKEILNKVKMIEIISSLFSYHSRMKLEINKRRKTKFHKYMEIIQSTHEQSMCQRRN